jgi:LSD1 subclass zinc finger protein
VQTFECPSCGGTLDYADHRRSVKCPYCDTVALVPEALRQPVEQAQAASQWKRWIAVFLVVTVVLPTCLGLVGTVLGIGGGIFAVILPFLLSIFGR